MKKAIVFVSDGSEEIETLTPVDYLRRAGVEVRLVAAGSYTLSADGTPMVRSSHKVGILADGEAKAIVAQAELPDAVVVPGGMPGSTNLAADECVAQFVTRMDKAGKLVCAICAAPAVVLPATGALDGKDWTCYPGMEKEAAAFAQAHKSGVPFVHSKNLITARGPGAAEEFAIEIVRALCGPEKAAQVSQAAYLR